MVLLSSYISLWPAKYFSHANSQHFLLCLGISFPSWAFDIEFTENICHKIGGPHSFLIWSLPKVSSSLDNLEHCPTHPARDTAMTMLVNH